jgi:hypothetical protein
MFRVPRNQTTAAIQKARPRATRGLMRRTGSGANQVSHHWGCSPVPQKSAAEVTNTAAAASRKFFFVVGLVVGLACDNSGRESI